MKQLKQHLSMNKILIIGQAPPEKKQELPYDSTMLYEWLNEVGISKVVAQDMFDFEAMSSELRGKNKNGGHLPPLKLEKAIHYNNVLKPKCDIADKIILLGKPAITFFFPEGDFFNRHDKWLMLPHPSRRNYNLYQKNKGVLLQMLKDFIKS